MRKILLVTGGASGIGAAVAELAAADGYAVAINYRSRAAQAEAMVGAINATGGRAMAVKADVGDPEQIEPMFAAIDGQLGPLTALVNCAGIDGGVHRADAFTAGALRHLLDVNVVGPMLCCGAAIRRMSTRHGGNGGAIVNVSSIAATIGGRPGKSHYAASKAALDSFTIGLAKEVALEGIRANVMRPGAAETPMTAGGLADPKIRAAISATLAMNRVGTASEMARVILWLLSDAASFVSGACVDANGGGFLIAGPSGTRL
ncbi:MAG: SDR family oxidoreductase [Alphaproteobacteria bacterium]|nr:SDR family oxidoreductase [Alphaproteobacteria bacterium]